MSTQAVVVGADGLEPPTFACKGCPAAQAANLAYKAVWQLFASVGDELWIYSCPRMNPTKEKYRPVLILTFLSACPTEYGHRLAALQSANAGIIKGASES
jgi:hypothetical protein